MTTPMRSQYLALKKQYPDIILLFRLGDFYETFDDDARIVSSVCDVVLTSRPVGANERVPLAPSRRRAKRSCRAWCGGS